MVKRATPESFVADVRAFRIKSTANMERLVKISSAVVAEAALANVPVRTGRLRRSPRTKVGRGGDATPGYKAQIEAYRLGEPIRIAWHRFYAHIVEKGYTSRKGRRIPGRRFVRRAVRQWPAIAGRVARRIARESARRPIGRK